ncbi:MAG: hypothetical protein AMS16_03285 [Planctomycetes bacterium DG_58]|nr:MAG: hypothetical protein AMS16_03285 [Planctomycetes bacterium DG_58]
MRRRLFSIRRVALVGICLIFCVSGREAPAADAPVAEPHEPAEQPRKTEKTRQTGDKLSQLVEDARSILAELEEPRRVRDQKQQWQAAYRMVSELGTALWATRNPPRKQVRTVLEARRLTGKLRAYLRKNIKHADELSAAVAEAEAVLAKVRRGGAVKKRQERWHAAYRALTDLRTAMRAREKAGEPFPEMLLDAHRLTLDLRKYLREDLKDADLRCHMDLAYKIDEDTAFERLRSYGELLLKTGRREAGPFFRLLAERAQNDEEKESALYWYAEVMHGQQGTYGITAYDRLQAAQEYVKHFPKGIHLARIRYLEGDAYYSMGKLDDALARFEEARKMDQELSDEAGLAISRCCYLKKEYQKALRELEKIKPTTRLMMANCQGLKRQIERAMKRTEE